MKLTKLMLSAFAAAVAMVACNKVEVDVPESTALKTVNLSLENVIMTKGPAGDKIKANDPVKVNNFKIIITDDSYSMEYGAKADAAGATDATFYFTAEAFAEGAKTYQFHYVDHKATRVIAVANMGDVTLQQIKSYTKEIKDQQDQNNLILVADAVLEATGESHTIEESGKFTEVYEAEATLKPVISRFEVDGFSVDFSTDPKFNKIEVTDIAFDHYYPTVGFSTTGGTLGALPYGSHIKNPNNYDSESDVFGWLNNSATTGWYVDRFESGKVVMIPDDPATTEVFENRADTPTPLAYHFFAGDAVPVMIIRVLADGNPAYLYTTRFKSNSSNEDISVLEGGKIYRMSAAGVVDQTGGSIPLPDDLDPIQRCLDITVDVQDWVVELVTPEFN